MTFTSWPLNLQSEALHCDVNVGKWQLGGSLIALFNNKTGNLPEKKLPVFLFESDIFTVWIFRALTVPKALLD